MEMLAHALDILANICRWRDLLPAVVATPDVVAVLTERLQMFRDVEVSGAAAAGGWGGMFGAGCTRGVGGASKS
jgi:hypothetical protein